MRLILLILLIQSCFLLAGPTFSQHFQIVSQPSASLSVSKNPKKLAVTLDINGVGSAVDSSTTYTVRSNTGSERVKITGVISSGGVLPENTSLTIALASLSGLSQGAVALATVPVDLVIQIPSFTSETGVITYRFSVTKGWLLPAQTMQRTVTLTVVSAG